MGHVKIPLQMSWIKGRIWIPGKRMLSSVSRGPSVSLNFGVFFFTKKPTEAPLSVLDILYGRLPRWDQPLVAVSAQNIL
jgi:hypothetical protein